MVERGEGSEMSSLKQKAKTLEVWIKEICHENWCYACPISKHHNCDNLRLIRLEDAQKEIEFQKARADVANEMVTSKQKRIDELKQKLQQFKNLLSKENEPKLHIGSANFTNIALFRMHMEKLRKKFDELLKEEKEAKP
jgi:hypothetical protein